VVAFRRGALPEIVQDGTTGFLVEGVVGAVAALRRIREINSQACREHARKSFSCNTMAQAYVALYERVISREAAPDRLLCGRQQVS
jgi:glycosyltransferase involved in cell wall biosynthesis